VDEGQPLLRLHHRRGRGLDDARALLAQAIEIRAEATPPQPLVLERIP
jgi:pyrimidine-nucleoside phosphorylase/thymidine phosphorylase